MNRIKRLVNTDAYPWLRDVMKGKWGAFWIIAILQIIISSSGALQAIFSKELIDRSIHSGFRQGLPFLLAFAFILVMQIVLNAFLSLRVVRLRESLNNDLQHKFMHRLYRSEWGAANRYHSGNLLTHLTSDVNSVSETITVTAPGVLALVVQFATAFGTLLFYDATLAVFAFVLGPVSVLASWFIGRRLKALQHQIQNAEGQYRSLLHESIQNLMIVKTFENEEDSLRQIRRSQDNRLYWIIRRNRFNVAADVTLGSGYRFGFFLAFIWGAYRVSNGQASFGMFTAFLQLVGQIQGPLEGLSRMLPGVFGMIASAERLVAFHRIKPEKRTAAAAPEGEAGLSIEGAAYSYVTGKPILRDVNVKIRPGELVALVGTSGEGKTTLLRLLLALMEPDAGRILLESGSGEQRTLSADTRAYFSYVPQGNTLFSGSIADNLRIGRPDATPEQMMDALEAACAKGFVERLPEGVDTRIGEHGSGLSEGQAQRIAIARALLRPAPILLLDEATSALDMDTEWKVLCNIRSLKPRRTCIAITHRLSVFDVCDEIYRLSDGRLYRQQREDALKHAESQAL
ncbi:ABC transporter ATP-binding protein [Paenibacillus spiritus]|uniref:ABC transporter ATP-binding protein n=1 Tax=Paenibacillus spiritus TaxID=2496557 RepID=A0A5J5FUY7_9BACL|nr:ABC transporter ATP-binding protein [Paenibacillus spiritus]KAA8997574.1 ABC transporter ATP-binding protein [Paenibacillus spiritus]